MTPKKQLGSAQQIGIGIVALLVVLLLLWFTVMKDKDINEPVAKKERQYSKSVLVLDVAQQVGEEFGQLQNQLHLLKNSIEAYCEDTSSEGGLARVQQGWLASMKAWQRVQGLTIGPAVTDNRKFRIDYYLLTSHDYEQLQKRMAKWIESGDEISPSTVAELSVDLQGLPALEMVLFQDDAESHFTNPELGPRYCLYAEGISNNLFNLADILKNEWSEGGEYYALVTEKGREQQSLDDILNTVAEHLQIIETKKITRAIESPEYIESGIARSSLDNIATNIALIQLLFDPKKQSGLGYYLVDAGEEKKLTALNDAMAEVQKQLAAQDKTMTELVKTEAGLKKLEALKQSVHRVFELLAKEVIGVFEVNLGFSSSDGD